MSERAQAVLLPLAISLPLLVYAAYYVSSAPPPPPRRKLVIHPGLASLPESHRAREIYPEEFFEGGKYVDLPYGRTRYWVLEPPSEERIGRRSKIVLILGLLTPCIQWSKLAPALVESGFDVLVYDLYGRGYSDTPDTTYNTELYVTQLALLMRHIGWNKAMLCGLSMGGGIAAAFTRAFPEMVEKHIFLVSSAGIMQNDDREQAIAYMPRPIANAYFPQSPLKRFVNSLPSLRASKNGDMDPILEFVNLQCTVLPQHVKAAVSSLRDGPVIDLQATFGSAQFEDKKVLIFQGTNDPIVPFKYSGLILSALPLSAQKESRIIAIPGGGHDLPQTHAEKIVEEMIEFMYPSNRPVASSRSASPVPR